MAARNDITGDEIRSKPSKEYADNWERIFGKKKEETKEDKPTNKE